MNENVFTFQSTEPGTLDWLLRDFVERVPGVLSAVLGTGDGLRMADHGLDETQRDHLSAIITGLFATGRLLGEVVGDPEGSVGQVVVQHRACLLFVTEAGDRSVLGVVTASDADPGLVGHRMTTLVTSLSEHLGAAARTE